MIKLPRSHFFESVQNWFISAWRYTYRRAQQRVYFEANLSVGASIGTVTEMSDVLCDWIRSRGMESEIIRRLSSLIRPGETWTDTIRKVVLLDYAAALHYVYLVNNGTRAWETYRTHFQDMVMLPGSRLLLDQFASDQSSFRLAPSATELRLTYELQGHDQFLAYLAAEYPDEYSSWERRNFVVPQYYGIFNMLKDERLFKRLFDLDIQRVKINVLGMQHAFTDLLCDFPTTVPSGVVGWDAPVKVYILSGGYPNVYSEAIGLLFHCNFKDDILFTGDKLTDAVYFPLSGVPVPEMRYAMSTVWLGIEWAVQSPEDEFVPNPTTFPPKGGDFPVSGGGTGLIVEEINPSAPEQTPPGSPRGGNRNSNGGNGNRRNNGNKNGNGRNAFHKAQQQITRFGRKLLQTTGDVTLEAAGAMLTNPQVRARALSNPQLAATIAGLEVARRVVPDLGNMLIQGQVQNLQQLQQPNNPLGTFGAITEGGESAYST